MNGARGDGTSRKVVAREQTRGELRVRQRDVDEDTLEHDEDADGEDDDADRGHDPVDFGRRVARPCEDEKTDGQEQAGWQCGDEASLGLAQSLGQDLRLEHVPEVVEVHDDGDADTDGDGQEDEADLACVHAVAVRGGAGVPGRVDERENLEERVEDAVHERRVQAGEEHGGVERVDLHGPPEIADHHFVDAHLLLVDLRLGFQVGVAGHLAQTLGAAQQDVAGRSLREEEQEGDVHGRSEPDNLPQ